jgi:hypothetical protein
MLEHCLYIHLCGSWKKNSFKCRYFYPQCQLYTTFKEDDRKIEEELTRHQARDTYANTPDREGADL